MLHCKWKQLTVHKCIKQMHCGEPVITFNQVWGRSGILSHLNHWITAVCSQME